MRRAFEEYATGRFTKLKAFFAARPRSFDQVCVLLRAALEHHQIRIPSVLLQRSHICPRQYLRGHSASAAQLKARTQHGTQRFRDRCTIWISNNRRFDQ